MNGMEVIAISALAGIFIAGTGFWLWMLIECLTKEPDAGNTKICWVLIIVFAHFIGALIYFVVRRDRRYVEVGR